MNHVRDLSGVTVRRNEFETGFIRATLFAAIACSLGACANEPLNGGQPNFAPMMNLTSPAAAAEVAPVPGHIDDLSKKSLAAKVLASRALESVTGLKTDPARLSEHD
jgi:hypothetical protein